MMTVIIHQPYHFTWLIPFLTVYFMANDRKGAAWFALIFIGAYLASLGYSSVDPFLMFVEPLLAGFFYGIKATYLVKVNLNAVYAKAMS